MTAAAPGATTATSRGVLRTLWRLAFLMFAVVAVLVALAIGLFRILVPMVPDFHERIETAAGNALGVPVTVEKLDVRWRWRGPELVFEGVRVLDAERDSSLLEARDGHVNLNVGAFLSRRAVVPDYVVLRGLDIEVFRDVDGAFSVLGRRARRGESAPLLKSDSWPLPDGLYLLRDSRVRYTTADAPPTVVSGVNVNVSVTGRRMRIDGDLEPPEGMGRSLEVSAELDRRSDQARSLVWQVYLAGSDLELGAVNRIAGAAVLPFSSGRGSVVAWAEFEGLRVQNASLDLDATNIQFARTDLPYRRVRGRLELDDTALGWRLHTQDLYIDRGERAWPAINAALSYDVGPEGTRRYHLQLPFARLSDVWPLAELLPAGPIRQSLVAHRPTGDLFDIDATFERSPDDVPTVIIDGRFERIGWSASQRIPGVDGLSGRVHADTAGGRLTIDTDKVSVVAPHLFNDALKAWRLSGTVGWSRSDDGWRVHSDNVLLATEHFDALANARVQWQGGTAPVIDIDANIGDLDIVSGLGYLPVGVMKPRLVKWLNDALQGGTVRAAELSLHGPLDAFPFGGDDAPGEFTATVEVEDLVMAFAPDWPAATNIDSRVYFSGRTLSATVSDALFGEAHLFNGDVAINDLANAVVEVTAATRAPIEVVRDYIQTTPVGKNHERLLADLDPRGPAQTSISLDIPVRAVRTLDYRVDIDTQGVVLAYRDWPVALEDIRGTVVIERSGIFAPAADAVLLSRPVVLSLDTAPLRIGGVDTPQVRVEARGRTDANVFAQRIHPPLAEWFSGVADWEASIAFPPALRPDALPTTVDLTTDLAGLAVHLPAPLTKGSAVPRALRARLDVHKDAPMHVTLDYDEQVSAQLAVDTTLGWRVERGTVVVNDGPARLDERSGIALRGRVAQLDVDAWLAQFKNREGASDNGLRTAELSFDQATVLGQSLTAGTLSLARNVREWLIEVEAPEASGAIFLPRDYARGIEPVIANMQSLRWRSGEEDADGVDPRTLPSLHLDVQDFWFNEMNFGELTARFERVEDGIRIENIRTTGRGFTGDAAGTWRYADGDPSAFNMTIDSTDVAATMEALGSAGGIDADQATFTMNMNWDDQLDGGFMRDVYGQVSIAVGDGKLVSVDPRAGRVFGLISLAALPRRLSLDFRDVFQKGFAFDAIEGNFSVRGGNAFTDNLTLRGPAAQVAVVGRAGIADRDYEQTASVYANFGSSLPIAGALAGGPAVGAALLIFSEVFKDPLKQIGRVDYRITGSWEDPVFARINAGPSTGDTPRDAPGDAPVSEPLPPDESAPLADPIDARDTDSVGAGAD